jgi:hypothetical protein
MLNLRDGAMNQVPQRRMRRLDWFYLISGIIGLAANLIFFVQLFSGSIALPPVGIFSNPFFVSGMFLILISYSIIACLLITAQRIAKRWERQGKQLDENYFYGLFIVSYLLWVPSGIIWYLSTIELFSIAGAPIDDSNKMLFGGTFLFLGVFFGGILAMIADRLREFFNP